MLSNLVTCDNETKEKQPIIAIVKKNLLPLIRENFKTFTADLINAHRGDVQIDQPKISSQYKPKPVELPMRESVVPTSVLGAVASIDLEVELIASCADVYNVLINSDKIKMWTRSKCECDAVAGGKFTLFDGNITGVFKELELNKILGLHGVSKVGQMDTFLQSRLH